MRVPVAADNETQPHWKVKMLRCARFFDGIDVFSHFTSMLSNQLQDASRVYEMYKLFQWLRERSIADGKY